MKIVVRIFALILFTSVVFAQAPQKMSYQAIVRNDSNALVVNHAIGMRISILQGSATGTALYVELQTPVSNDNGLVSIEIGSGASILGFFSSIDWANGPYFVQTETDPAGGTNYSVISTSQLLSVPYALYAANAGTVLEGAGFKHFIGELYGGGVIFNLWKDSAKVEHGLIVDLTDLSNLQPWSNINQTLIGPSAQSYWDGMNNSIAIVSQAGHTSSAAALCLNSTNGGQSDWYLPSCQELNLLWNNYFFVSRTLSQISSATQLSSARYWSSSESYLTNAWYFYFTVGNASSYAKDISLYVRAVRQF